MSNKVPIIPPLDDDDVVFTKEECIVRPELRSGNVESGVYLVPVKHNHISEFVEDETVKNELEEFIDKTKNDTYESTEMTEDDVFLAKVKSFSKNISYDIKNKDLVADNILELVLNITLVMLLNDMKVSDFTDKRRMSFISLMKEVRNYINVKTLEMEDNAEKEYLVLRNEILLTYVISSI